MHHQDRHTRALYAYKSLLSDPSKGVSHIYSATTTVKYKSTVA